uniref:UBC core domain-containing protein n=1 Tax=Noctiluca scintillans TaxID=2966 RepID=A0A7S1F4U3_NOCSC|mmetsp:Transcript_32321/g.86617  ORF Transcript_32321/g.86617 Transcript_32321/m.86617 type:complete len:158 (+) Transcript_32321:102-575(+)|eukprot:CAMPEP_0194544280 /NCGR_PEP_ID=MMETSP0253-20130528/87288_1 /TAXON_ID=2966 /ORGANISM="Noctiluca scintillans" /LENGTH=157 /DNA_ID=CAMNT_0039391147 /DNA_START=41 /DNA_END=514 /DNA_ORIENTATION=-
MEPAVEIDFSSRARVRLHEEFRLLSMDPPALCSAGPDIDDWLVWQATVVAPQGSLYIGCIFHLKMTFPCSYPEVAPECRLLTNLRHMNAGGNGTIRLKIVEQWHSELTVRDLLMAIVSMLVDPDPSYALDGDLAMLFKSNRPKHDQVVREYMAKIMS